MQQCKQRRLERTNFYNVTGLLNNHETVSRYSQNTCIYLGMLAAGRTHLSRHLVQIPSRCGLANRTRDRQRVDMREISVPRSGAP